MDGPEKGVRIQQRRPLLILPLPGHDPPLSCPLPPRNCPSLPLICPPATLSQPLCCSASYLSALATIRLNATLAGEAYLRGVVDRIALQHFCNTIRQHRDCCTSRSLCCNWALSHSNQAGLKFAQLSKAVALKLFKYWGPPKKWFHFVSHSCLCGYNGD